VRLLLVPVLRFVLVRMFVLVGVLHVFMRVFVLMGVFMLSSRSARGTRRRPQ